MIFISYKREDEALARTVYERLADWGHQGWLDVLDVKAGEDWDTSIFEGLKKADIVVGFMAPESLASRNVLNEWAYALSTEKRLVLIQIRHIAEREIPHQYIRIQRIDCIGSVEDGLNNLRHALSQPNGTQTDSNQAELSLTSNQYNFLSKYWSLGGKLHLGKRFTVTNAAPARIFHSADIEFSYEITDSEVMRLARLGYLHLYSAEPSVVFTDRIASFFENTK